MSALGYGEVQRLESFHALAHAARLLDVIARVLGAGPLVHPTKILRALWPDAPEETTRPHQDFPYIQGPSDVLTAWIPLTDCPRALGGLRVAPGSHRTGLRRMKRVGGAGGFGVLDPPARRGDWLTLDYAAGDVVLFHSLTIHAGTPNRTDRLRVSVDYRYQRATEPIARAYTEPQGTARRWADVTPGWTSTRWVDLTPGTPVFELVRPGEDLDTFHRALTVAPSMFMPAPGAGGMS